MGAAIVSKTSSSATARFQIQNSSGVAIGDWYSTPADNGQHFNNAASGGTPYIAFEIAGTAVLYSTTGGVSIGTAAAPTGILDLAGSTSSRASLRIRAGTAPSGTGGPNAGDIWYPTGGRLSLYRAATEIFATGVQATGGAATAGASYTSAEQSMLQKVYDACRAFGLLS